MIPDSKALIITVNYCNAEATLEFLTSASRLEGFENLDLLVADNDSTDDSVVRIRRAISQLSNVEVLASDLNRGYFGGASWALRQYLARHVTPDWVLVCNNDIVFDDPRFLSRLLAEDPASAGVIAPSVISSLTGHDANPSIRRRPSRFRMLRYRLSLSNYYVMWFKQWLSPLVRRVRHKLYKWTASSTRGLRSPIYAPHGSFLIISRKFFEAGGFIDDGFFLYAEEFCVAEMCRHLGLPIIHEPELRVWHNENQTTGRMLSRKIYSHQKSGFRYALARYEHSYPELGNTRPIVATVVVEEASDTSQASSAGRSAG
jgi:GT2 family glycosyltransferase